MMPSFGMHGRQPLSHQRPAAAAFADIDEPKPGLSIFKNIQSSGGHVRTTSNSSSTDDPLPPPPPLPPPSLRLPQIASKVPATLPDTIKRPAGDLPSAHAKLQTPADVDTPLKPPTIAITAGPPHSSSVGVPTTTETGSISHFKTPSAPVVEFTSQRPHRGHSRFPPIVRTKSAKSKSEMQSEFQSKKVLFHTPSTLHAAGTMPLRAAIALSDHSIDLSLNDSVPAPVTATVSAACSSVVVVGLPAIGATGGTSASVASPPVGAHVLHINGKVFVVQRKIGAGGSSVVYLAQRWDTDEEVAVKVVDLQGDDAVVTGYVNETKLLAKLQGDASVIRLFE